MPVDSNPYEAMCEKGVSIYIGERGFYFFLDSMWAVIYLVMLYLAFRLVKKWFFHTKEFLADKYAMLCLNHDYVPRFSGKADLFHPAPEQRLSSLIGKTSAVNFFPVLFFILLLFNVGFTGVMKYEFGYFEFIFYVSFGFLPLIIVYPRLFYFRFRGLLLLLFISVANIFFYFAHHEFDTYLGNWGRETTDFNVLLTLNAFLGGVALLYGIVFLLMRIISKRVQKS